MAHRLILRNQLHRLTILICAVPTFALSMGWGNTNAQSLRVQETARPLDGSGADPNWVSPVNCEAAIWRIQETGGAVLKWIRESREDHSITQVAGYEAHRAFYRYIRLSLERGRRAYTSSDRFEDGDTACAVYLEARRNELSEKFQIVRREVVLKGNRDLAGTGINPRASRENR